MTMMTDPGARTEAAGALDVHDHSNPLPETRFRDIWLYCMLDHQVGTMPSGPCFACVRQYAVSGPPDGRWNEASADA